MPAAHSVSAITEPWTLDRARHRSTYDEYEQVLLQITGTLDGATTADSQGPRTEPGVPRRTSDADDDIAATRPRIEIVRGRQVPFAQSAQQSCGCSPDLRSNVPQEHRTSICMICTWTPGLALQAQVVSDAAHPQALAGIGSPGSYML